jgi:hypothetical protein
MNAVHLSTATWISLVITSGLAAAILTKMGDAVLAKFQRSHQTKSQRLDFAHQAEMQKSEQEHQSQMQIEAREHESLLRLIAGHDNAREEHLPRAVGSYEWLQHELGEKYGADYEWLSVNEPQPSIDSVTEVIRALRQVELTHPTRSVRKVASDLCSGISAHYGTIGSEWDEKLRMNVDLVGPTPTESQILDWVAKANRLVQLIHTPPGLNDVRPSQESSANEANQLDRSEATRAQR